MVKLISKESRNTYPPKFGLSGLILKKVSRSYKQPESPRRMILSTISKSSICRIVNNSFMPHYWYCQHKAWNRSVFNSRRLEMCMDFHKGMPCVYKPILCQEGYCSECSVFHDSLQHSGLMNEHINAENLVELKTKELISSLKG